MPDLIWFEWEKCPDGYTVETLRPEYLQFDEEEWLTTWIHPTATADGYTVETLRPEYLQIGEEEKFCVHPTAIAPSWVCEFLHNRGYGFSLYERKLVGGEFLIPQSDNILKFRPLEGNSAAFMDYAHCYDSASNTVNFVTEYGLPGEESPSSDLWLLMRSTKRIQGGAGLMRDAVGVWDDAKQKNDFGELLLLFNRGRLPESRDDFDYDALIDQSRALTSVKLRHRGDRDGPPLLSMVPEDLEAALWLQFGQAVSANSQLQRCAVCPTWFSYGTGTGRRKSAHYCTDRCRKAAHRNRKEAAK